MFNKYKDFRNSVHFNSSSEKADVENSAGILLFGKESGYVIQAAVGSHVIYIVFCVCVCVCVCVCWGWKVGMQMKLGVFAEIKQLLFPDIMSICKWPSNSFKAHHSEIKK